MLCVSADAFVVLRAPSKTPAAAALASAIAGVKNSSSYLFCCVAAVRSELVGCTKLYHAFMIIKLLYCVTEQFVRLGRKALLMTHSHNCQLQWLASIL